jgi:phage major head subunit gpT-like protein
MFMIADYKNKALIVLMSEKDQKYRTVMSMDPTLYNQSNDLKNQSESVDWDNVTEWRGYKKLGKRTIMGYSCDGYAITNDIGKSEVWVTRDELFGIEHFFNTGNMGMKSKFPSEMPYGMLVEMQAEDLKTGDKSVITLKEVKKGINQVIKVGDYPTLGQK